MMSQKSLLDNYCRCVVSVERKLNILCSDSQYELRVLN